MEQQSFLLTVAARILRIKVKEPGSLQIGYRPLVAGTRAADNNSVVARRDCHINPTRFQISHIQHDMAAGIVISSLRRRGSPPGFVSRTNFDKS